jgi:hypothetical protein
MTTEAVKEFYRALITPEHVNRWRRREFTSYYADNGSWWRTWQERQSLNAADYPLGVLTEQARTVFLDFVRSRRQHMTEDEVRRSQEYDGVCAFETPQAAFEYGGGFSPPAPTWYVTFEGVPKHRLPEEHGVVASVVIPFGSIMTPADFARIHLGRT